MKDIKFINKMHKKDKGFTLVEIIVVVVILAILAAFTIPTMLGFVSDAKDKAYIAEAREIYVAAQATATEKVATSTGIVTVVALQDDLKGTAIATGTTVANTGMNKMLGTDISEGAKWTVVAEEKVLGAKSTMSAKNIVSPLLADPEVTGKVLSVTYTIPYTESMVMADPEATGKVLSVTYTIPDTERAITITAGGSTVIQ